MKQVTLWLLFCSFFLACKKEKVYVVNPPQYLQFKIDKVVNDSTIVLSWTKFTDKNFKRYKLQRSALYLKNGQFSTFTDEIYSGSDVNEVSFTEDKMPFAKDITYNLYVVTYPDGNARDSIKAWRSVTYQRTKGLMTGTPVDILVNKQRKWLYITENQKVSLIDYSTGQQITSKEFPVKIGYCAQGDFNGANELYVPVYDGTVLILDGATLQQKEKIYVGGLETGSVVSVNGKLYVSSTNLTDVPNSTYIKIYDRATKTLTSKTGQGANTRLLLLEGTSVEMVDLGLSIWTYSDLKYYQFTATGQPVTSQKSYGYNDYTTANSAIMRSFPDGSKFITTSYGSIYSKPLNYQGNLTATGTYSDYAFNADGSTIYAANSSQKKIEAIAYPSKVTTKTYNTVLNPLRIFRDSDTLYTLGSFYQYSTNYMIIEKVKL